MNHAADPFYDVVLDERNYLAGEYRVLRRIAGNAEGRDSRTAEAGTDLILRMGVKTDDREIVTVKLERYDALRLIDVAIRLGYETKVRP